MRSGLYSIGEVAKLNNISIETLRHYDRIGLFMPAFTDDSSRYRYYHEKQFFYLDIIKYLKYIGTPLNQIKEIMKKDAEELLPFFDKQSEVIDEKIEQLQRSKQMLYNHQLQIKEQTILLNSPRGQVYNRFIDAQDQLHLMTSYLTPYGNPDVYMRELANLLETKENRMVGNFYGCVYDLKSYQATEEIIYSSIYTSLIGNEQLMDEPKEGMMRQYLASGTYVCICFKWNESQYLQYYKILYEYIMENKLLTEGPVYEVSLPNRYFSYEEDDFITELRVKLKDD